MGEDPLAEAVAKAEEAGRLAWGDAVDRAAQPGLEGDLLVGLEQQRVEVEHAELPVAGPRLSLPQRLEGADVDEDRLRAAELDVVGGRVLQRSAPARAPPARGRAAAGRRRGASRRSTRRGRRRTGSARGAAPPRPRRAGAGRRFRGRESAASSVATREPSEVRRSSSSEEASARQSSAPRSLRTRKTESPRGYDHAAVAVTEGPSLYGGLGRHALIRPEARGGARRSPSLLPSRSRPRGRRRLGLLGLVLLPEGEGLEHLLAEHLDRDRDCGEPPSSICRIMLPLPGSRYASVLITRKLLSSAVRPDDHCQA